MEPTLTTQILKNILCGTMDPEIAQKLSELRKLERQAKQLLYKMERIESAWNALKKELKGKGREIPHHLGDILQGWRPKSQ